MLNIDDKLNEDVEKRVSKNKKKWIYLLSLLLILIVSIGGYIWLSHPTDDFFIDKEAKDGLIEARTEEEIQKVLDTVVSKGMFNVSINPNPVFKNGKAKGDLWIENIKANHYYTKVTIMLEDSKKVVFKSDGIKPNQNIEKAKLSKVLKKGEYPSIATFKIIDPKTLDEIGVVNVKITITIQA